MKAIKVKYSLPDKDNQHMQTRCNYEDQMRRRVFIVEGDPIVAQHLVAALLTGETNEIQSSRLVSTNELIECTVVPSQRAFFETDPALWDIVITASGLHDGNGFEILAFVQGLRPDVPVILTGDPEEADGAVEAIRAGAADYLMLTGHEMITLPVTIQKCLALQVIRSENDDLHADLSQSLSELGVANRELQLMIQRLEVAARTDDLTKLSNRRWLNLMIEGRWEESMRSGMPMAFLMIDLDGFKTLNDRLGHHKGDEVLRLAARVLEANCRSIDIAARFGGDEFGVLMPHADTDAAIQVAHRIAAAFDEAIAALELPGTDVSMSIGVAHWELTNPVNADELVRHADEAMYAAKEDPNRRVMIRTADGKSAAA